MIKQIIDYKGQKVEIIWYDNTNFEELPNITQVYGVCFKKEKY